MKNKVYIVGHSLSPQSAEIITVLATFPRIILSEINTHRMLSKNTSSSRAIPFQKMLEAVQNNPFIPFAWQKYHPGMQGSEYLDETVKYDLISFMDILNNTLSNTEDEKERARLSKRIEEKTKIIKELLTPYTLLEKTLPEWWLFARDKAVEAASILYVFDVTKQLCNRLLEPFMWTTMLITGSREGWNNFFNLRLPSYVYGDERGHYALLNSRKEYIDFCGEDIQYIPESEVWWLSINKGQAEIHMMDLAEKIYDAVNESTPRKLAPGKWHIPFYEQITDLLMNELADDEAAFIPDEKVAKISVAMAAHTSYTVVGGEVVKSSKKWLELHDRLLSYDPPHSSPMEHCARAMSVEEYYRFVKGYGNTDYPEDGFREGSYGWCNNLKGFIPYRYFIDNKIEV